MHSVDDQGLQTTLGRAFPGATVQAWSRLNGGVSSRATRADIVLPNGSTRSVVVRRPSHATREGAIALVRRERRLLEHCVRHGLSAPVPHFVDERSAAIVLSWLPGAPDFQSNAGPLVAQLAAKLHRIHSVPTSGLEFLPPRRESADVLVTSDPAQPDATLDEPQLHAVVRSLWPWPAHNPDVLLHGDYWPGNVLFDEGRLSAVIDWEESELGDPLSDLAIARLDITWAFGAEAAEEFTERYRALTDRDFRNLPRWDLLTALRSRGALERWSASYECPPISRPDITAETMARGRRAFVQQALERLGLTA